MSVSFATLGEFSAISLNRYSSLFLGDPSNAHVNMLDVVPGVLYILLIFFVIFLFAVWVG